MEILINEQAIYGVGVGWLSIHNTKRNEKVTAINEMKSLHTKYYVKRNFKASKYQLVLKFLKKYDIPISEEQQKIFEKVFESCNLNMIEDAEEILLLSNIAYQINQQRNLPQEEVNKLYENIESESKKQLEKEIKEFSTNDKCISCYNVYKFEEQKLLRCGNCKCKLFAYCSKKCQKEDWKTHKGLCNSVKKAGRKLKEEVKKIQKEQEEAEAEEADEAEGQVEGEVEGEVEE